MKKRKVGLSDREWGKEGRENKQKEGEEEKLFYVYFCSVSNFLLLILEWY